MGRAIRFLIVGYAIIVLFWLILGAYFGRKWGIRLGELLNAVTDYDLHTNPGWYRWSKEQYDQWKSTQKPQFAEVQ